MEMTKYKLGDLCRIASSKRIFESEYVEKGVPFIRGQEISDGSILDPKASFECYISQSRYEEIKEKYGKPTKGDILITAVGTIGNLCYLDKDIDFYFKDGNVIWFSEIISSCEGKFLFHFMKSSFFKDQLKYFMIGAVQKALTIDMLKKVEVPLPPLSDQKKIASVLSALDDKIALNKKMDQKLEAMAKRLYDYWFVQFDFPDKNGHPYKTTGGPMTYNPTLKREIPVGWEVVDINELCQVVDCLHSKKPDFCYEDENSYLLALENITKEGYIDLSDKYYISKKDFAEWTSRICVRENDFLFTNAGRAGDMGMVPEGVLCAIGRNITAVRPEKINPWYLRCFFKSLYMQEQILNNLDQGSFFMSFNVRSIKKLQVLMPSEPLMKKFISFVEPHLKRIEKNNKEISRLTALRDKLLPLLMNGQVTLRG